MIKYNSSFKENQKENELTFNVINFAQILLEATGSFLFC